jgi:hypothetical protein
MADTPINVPIDVNLRNTSGLTQLEARVAELRRQFRHLQTQIDTTFSGFTGGRGDFPPTPGGFFPPPPPNAPRPFPNQPLPAGHPLRVAMERQQVQQDLVQEATAQSNRALGRMNLESYQQLQLMAGMARGQIPTGGGPPVTYGGKFTPWQPGMTNPNLSGARPVYGGHFAPWQPGMTNPNLSGAMPQYLGKFVPWQPGMTNPNLSGATPQYLGKFTPWQPGMTNPNLSGARPVYGGHFTPWQPGMTNPNLSGTLPQYLGNYTPWQPGMTNPNLSGTTPTYEGHFTPWYPGMTNPNLSGTTPQYLGHFSPWQPGARGPGSGGGVGAEGGAAKTLGWIGRQAGRLGGLAVGYGAYQLVSKGMEDYETRFMGILRIGSMLDQQYQDVDTTLVRLRKTYQVLGQEGVAALTIIGRAGGAPGDVDQTIAVGRAYGIEPEQAAQAHATLALMGSERAPNLARVTGARNWAAARGIRMLPNAAFLSEVEQIAGTGGLGFAPLSGGQYGALGALMSSFGGRFAGQPGAAYGEYAAGVGGGAGTAMADALRQRAMAMLADKTPTVQLGDRTLNIRGSYWDRMTALENAGQIGAVQQALFEQVQREAGGNQDLGKFYYQQLFGAQSKYAAGVQYEGLRNIATSEPGGIAGFLQRGGSIEDVDVAARLARERAGAPEGTAIRKSAAEIQALGETGFIAGLEKIRTDVGKAVGALSEHSDAVKATTEAYKQLSPVTRDVLAFFTAIAALARANPWLGGLAVGLGIARDLPEDLARAEELRKEMIELAKPDAGATAPRTTK